MQVLKDEVRSAILRAARSAFLTEGYERASMKRIAADVGVAVGNLYRYYPNKEAMFQAVIAPAAEAMSRLIGDHPEAENRAAVSKPEMAETLAILMSDVLLKHREGLLILYYGSEDSPFAGVKQRLVGLLAEHVGEHLHGREQGGLIARPIALAFLEGFFDIMRGSERQETIRRAAKAYIEVWFQGLQQSAAGVYNSKLGLSKLLRRMLYLS